MNEKYNIYPWIEIITLFPLASKITFRKKKNILYEKDRCFFYNIHPWLKGEAEAARQHGDQHINNMTKLRRWRADSNEEMDSLEYAKEENCQQQECFSHPNFSLH